MRARFYYADNLCSRFNAHVHKVGECVIDDASVLVLHVTDIKVEWKQNFFRDK